MSEQIKVILHRAKDLHFQLKITSEELEKYLNFLKLKASEKPKFAPCGGCMSKKIDIKPSLLRAFNTLSQRQRADFYLKNVLLAKEILQNRGENILPPRQQVKTSTWYFYNQAQKQWETKVVEINSMKLTVKIRSTKQEMDLHNYIMRVSKKKDNEKKILALQSIESLQLPQTVRLSNSKQSADEFKQILTRLFDQGLRENIERMALSESKNLIKSQMSFRLAKNVEKQEDKQQKLRKKESLIILNLPSYEDESEGKSKPNPSQFKKLQEGATKNGENVKESVIFQVQKGNSLSQEEKMKSNLINSLTNSENLQIYRKNVLINLKQNRLRKIYEYKEQDSSLPFEWFSDNFMVSSSFRRWKKTLKESRTLSFNRQSHIKIFYEEHVFKDQCKVSYIYRRQKIQRDKNCLIFIDTPVNDNKYEPVNGKIDYAIWKFEKRYGRLEIIVQSKMAHGNIRMGYPSIQLTDEFLGSMDYICINLNMTLGNDTDLNVNSVLFEEEYLSQIDIFKDVPDDEDQFYTIVDDSDEELQVAPQPQKTHRTSRRISQQENGRFTFHQLTKSQYLSQPSAKNYLKFKHPQVPFQKGQPKLKHPIVQGEHPYFENEFNFTKDGEMISINEEKLKAQNSVLKSVLKTISKNIFSGKSILSISLPVTVFSVESNLSLICKSYAYAPNLLEKAAKEKDPVQRMKYVGAFAVTIGVAYVQMDKPFNPILGQTFQAIFDGCLVYGQQVAHHPPISSTFMVGRGYKLYGSFEAKVNIGINSATGSNQGTLHISFDDQNFRNNVYKIWFPPGEVTGLTFGARKLATTHKAFILDTENRLYLQLNYNKHKGVTEYCKFYDGIQGKIVQLSPNADISKIDKINKKGIIKEHGIFSGRWTKEIYYEDELIVDTWVDFAHAYEAYPCPLPSDAYFRSDLKYRVQNDYESAQTAKQQLQDLQRNDRQLRKKYTGKSH